MVKAKERLRKPLIFVCSPYRGDVETNVGNARCYCRLVIKQGGIPFAPHLLLTQFLDDSIQEERRLGMDMGLEMLKLCNGLWAFGPPTSGMLEEISAARAMGIPVCLFGLDGRPRHE